MGNTKAKPCNYTKHQIEMEITKAVHYIRLNRNRRVEQLKKKESPFTSYPLDFPDQTFDSSYHMGCINARLFIYAACCNALLRHLNILMEYSLALSMYSQGQGQPIKTGLKSNFYSGNSGKLNIGSIDDLVPSVNTLIYCIKALNISSLVSLEMMLENILGPHYVKLAREGYMVDIKLKNKIHSMIPNGEDVEAYLMGFIWRLSGEDPEKAAKIALKFGLIHLFQMKGHLYRKGNNAPGSGNTPQNGPQPGQGNSGNGGQRQIVQNSSDSFGINEPQNIENYFEQRQSQFGVPSIIPNEKPIQPEKSIPTFNIDPSSTVSKSVITIDASFNIAANDKLNELKLDDFKPPATQENDSTPKININNTDDFLNQLNNLKLNNDEQNMYDELQENKIKNEADKRLSQFKQSKIDPFKSGWQTPQNNLNIPGNIQEQPKLEADSKNLFTDFQKDNAPFSNFQKDNLTPENDRTYQDVKLASFAQQKGTPQPSINFGTGQNISGNRLEKAPDVLPVNFSYNQMMTFNRMNYDQNFRKYPHILTFY